MSLSVCPSCSRHVRERACPFCGASVAREKTITLPRVSRIALVGAAAAAAVTSIAACSSPQALYGCVCPPPDGGTDAHVDAIATFYGGVPVDAATTDATDATTEDAPTDATTDATDAGEE